MYTYLPTWYFRVEYFWISEFPCTIFGRATLTGANRLSTLGDDRDPQTILPLTDRILVPAIPPSRLEGRKATKRLHRACRAPCSHALVDFMELHVQPYTNRQRHLSHHGLVRYLPCGQFLQTLDFSVIDSCDFSYPSASTIYKWKRPKRLPLLGLPVSGRQSFPVSTSL